MKFVKWLKKAWVWLKTHWYVPVVAVAALVGALLSRDRFGELINFFLNNRKNYKEQIKKVEETYEFQIKEKERLQKELEEKTSELEEKHMLELDKIERDKEKRIEELKNDDDLAGKLKEEFDL